MSLPLILIVAPPALPRVTDMVRSAEKRRVDPGETLSLKATVPSVDTRIHVSSFTTTSRTNAGAAIPDVALACGSGRWGGVAIVALTELGVDGWTGCGTGACSTGGGG